MKRLGLAGLLLVCLLVPVLPAGAARLNPYAEVAPGSWQYGVVRELLGAGYFTGYPAPTFSDDRAMTRFDFTVALQRMVQQAEARVLGELQHRGPTEKGGDGERRAALALEIAGLQRLVREFGAEFAALGQEAEQVARRLDGLAQRLQRPVEPPRVAQAEDRRPVPVGAGKARRPGQLFHRNPPGLLGGRQAEPPIPRWLARGLTGDEPLAAAASDGTTALGSPVSLSVSPAAGEGMEQPGALGFGAPAPPPAVDARLSLPVGRTLISAFYRQVGQPSPEGDLWLPRGARPLHALEGFGGALHAPLGSFHLNVEGAALRDERHNPYGEVLFLRSAFRVALGRALTLDLGYERLRYEAEPLTMDVAEQYNVGFGHSLGRHARLQVLYQFTNLRRSLLGEPQAPLFDLNSHAAVTQFNIRF